MTDRGSTAQQDAPVTNGGTILSPVRLHPGKGMRQVV